jgi:hypothetical protein
MTTGSGSYKGLAVPIWGECEMFQRQAAVDCLTLTGANGHTADFLVAQIAAGTEKFVIDISGNLTIPGTLTAAGGGVFTGAPVHTAVPVLAASLPTTVPTTGMTTGEFFFYEKANVVWLAMAQDATQTWEVAFTENQTDN